MTRPQRKLVETGTHTSQHLQQSSLNPEREYELSNIDESSDAHQRELPGHGKGSHPPVGRERRRPNPGFIAESGRGGRASARVFRRVPEATFLRVALVRWFFAFAGIRRCQ